MTGHTLAPQELERLFTAWWRVPGAEDIPNTVANLDAQARELPQLPEWALQLRGAMPRWGMEICSHDWLAGLEALIEGIAQECYLPTHAGCCGNLPANLLDGAEVRAQGLDLWLSGKPPRAALLWDIANRLGELDDAKRPAAEAMLALLRLRLRAKYTSADWTSLVATLRARSESDPLLDHLLGDHALVDSLENACGFMLLHRLDWGLDLIGGDTGHDEKPGLERLGNCNAQLRLLWRYDPDRFRTTQAYLWGLSYWLDHGDDNTLRMDKPELSATASHVVSRLNQPCADDPLRRWLAQSLLVTTLLWARRVVRMSVEGFAATGAPDWANDLPDLD